MSEPFGLRNFLRPRDPSAISHDRVHRSLDYSFWWELLKWLAKAKLVDSLEECLRAGRSSSTLARSARQWRQNNVKSLLIPWHTGADTCVDARFAFFMIQLQENCRAFCIDQSRGSLQCDDRFETRLLLPFFLIRWATLVEETPLLNHSQRHAIFSSQNILWRSSKSLQKCHTSNPLSSIDRYPSMISCVERERERLVIVSSKAVCQKWSRFRNITFDVLQLLVSTNHTLIRLRWHEPNFAETLERRNQPSIALSCRGRYTFCLLLFSHRTRTASSIYSFPAFTYLHCNHIRYIFNCLERLTCSRRSTRFCSFRSPCRVNNWSSSSRSR